MTFDLEKARATYSAGCAEDAANLVPDLIAEIERLRDDTCLACAIKLEVIDQQAARIAELEELNAALMKHESSLRERAEKYRRRSQKGELRNKELEDALVEERARALWFEGDDPCDPPNLDWKTEPNDIPESVRLLWGESARQQLQAEGKIGPDADECPDDLPPIGSPYRSWQITDERRRALSEATTFLPEEYRGDTARIRNVLRAMLEAGQ